MSNQRKDKSSLAPYRELIEQLVADDPEITNQKIMESLPIKVGVMTVFHYRRKLGLPGSQKYKKNILAPYRTLIESLIEGNPQISNSAILKHLPIQVDKSTVGDYRHRLGLPCLPKSQSRLSECREQIERLVKDNPQISNSQILKLLPIKVGIATLAKYRHQLGLPVNLPSQDSGIKQYRNQIEQLVKANPTISNQEIIDQLTLPEISTTRLGKYRRRWGLPCNTPVSRGIPKYRTLIEKLVRNDPTISNRAITAYLPIDALQSVVGYFRRKWGLPCNPRVNKSKSILAEHHEQIKRLIDDNPGITNREIRNRLSIKIDLILLCQLAVNNYHLTSYKH